MFYFENGFYLQDFEYEIDNLKYFFFLKYQNLIFCFTFQTNLSTVLHRKSMALI